jgi:hypothetical protein
MADELARQGSASPFVGPEPAVPITISWVKSEIDKEARILHTRYWKNKPGHQHSKLFLREPLGVASRKILNMSKKRLRLLVGTVSGHFTCNNHLFNIGFSTSRICNRCETDAETMYHLVCLCPTLAKRRFCILGDYVLNLKEVQQVSLMKIVDFLAPLFLETSSPSI